MPLYEFECGIGHQFERVLPVAECSSEQFCDCGHIATRVYLTAPKGFVQKDICYDSPVTGRPVTSMAQRRQDLAKHGCSEYDPGMKQDYQRRIKREEAALDRSVDHFVDTEIAKMPARKLEKLESELKAGADATIVRNSP